MKKSAIWSWGLVLVLVLALALATVVEANLGMGYGRAWVYGTWWFRLLWLALAFTLQTSLLKIQRIKKLKEIKLRL